MHTTGLRAASGRVRTKYSRPFEFFTFFSNFWQLSEGLYLDFFSSNKVKLRAYQHVLKFPKPSPTVDVVIPSRDCPPVVVCLVVHVNKIAQGPTFPPLRDCSLHSEINKPCKGCEGVGRVSAVTRPLGLFAWSCEPFMLLFGD